MIPPDFKELGEDTDLWYRIEPDGSVLFTGDKPQGAKMLSETLPDGSKISGGFNRQGLLFGERISLTKNGVMKSQLFWRDYSTRPGRPMSPAMTTSSPSERTLNEQPRSPLDNPLFDPKKPKTWENPYAQSPPRMNPQEAREPETQDLQESRERIAKSVAKEKPKNGGPIAQKMRNLLGGSKRADYSDSNLEALTEAAEAIEKTMAEVERVREQNAQHVAELNQSNAENQQLRNELERVRSEAKTLLAQTIEEFGRKVKVRRWQVEAVPSNEVTIEGMESKILEIEDPEGTMRYVVVSQAPAGTGAQTLQQWQQDLRAQVDLMPFGGRAVYVFAPPGMRVDVLELVPGVNVDDAAGQF